MYNHYMNTTGKICCAKCKVKVSTLYRIKFKDTFIWVCYNCLQYETF